MKLFLFLLLLSFSADADVCDKIRCPQDAETYGCRVLTHNSPGPQMGWHEVRVWTKDKEGKSWSFLLSIRQPGEIKKAASDCGDFALAIRKRVIRRLRHERLHR